MERIQRAREPTEDTRPPALDRDHGRAPGALHDLTVAVPGARREQTTFLGYNTPAVLAVRHADKFSGHDSFPPVRVFSRCRAGLYPGEEEITLVPPGFLTDAAVLVAACTYGDAFSSLLGITVLSTGHAVRLASSNTKQMPL